MKNLLAVSESDSFVALFVKESHVFFHSWLVHLMADQFEKFSEGLLVSLTSLPISKFKIDFSEVHSDRFRSESFKKLGNEV